MVRFLFAFLDGARLLYGCRFLQDALTDFGKFFIGFLLLLQRLFQQRGNVFVAQFASHIDRRRISGDLIMLHAPRTASDRDI